MEARQFHFCFFSKDPYLFRDHGFEPVKNVKDGKCLLAIPPANRMENSPPPHFLPHPLFLFLIVNTTLGEIEEVQCTQAILLMSAMENKGVGKEEELAGWLAGCFTEYYIFFLLRQASFPPGESQQRSQQRGRRRRILLLAYLEDSWKIMFRHFHFEKKQIHIPAIQSWSRDLPSASAHTFFIQFLEFCAKLQGLRFFCFSVLEYNLIDIWIMISKEKCLQRGAVGFFCV